MTLTRIGLAVVLVLGPLLASRAADTQEPGKVARIGVLGPSSRSDSMFRFDAFRQGLRELGWVEGRNLVIESRWADGRTERLLDLAAELTRLNADVILVGATATAAAAKSATGTIPIVMASNESTEAPFSPPELWPMRWGVWGHRPKAVECSGAASPRGE